MIIELQAEASEYGDAARRAFRDAGGDELVRAAEADPDRRSPVAERVLAELGAWELRPRVGADELEASAALCRSAGYWVVPYPLAERLARPSDLAAYGLVPVTAIAPRAALRGQPGGWVAITPEGQRLSVVAATIGAVPHVSKFVTDLRLEPLDELGGNDFALVSVLECWTLLGMLDRALDLTRAYVKVRRQFGQPLSQFQSVRFQLADAEVDRSGLEALAAYTLWSVQTDRPEAVDDALALRLAALEAAESVLRISHQLHGAFGFCDEASLSWVSRNSTALRQLPMGLSATREMLTARIERRGLTGLFNGIDPADRLAAD